MDGNSIAIGCRVSTPALPSLSPDPLSKQQGTKTRASKSTRALHMLGEREIDPQNGFYDKQNRPREKLEASF